MVWTGDNRISGVELKGDSSRFPFSFTQHAGGKKGRIVYCDVEFLGGRDQDEAAVRFATQDAGKRAGP